MPELDQKDLPESYRSNMSDNVDVQRGNWHTSS